MRRFSGKKAFFIPLFVIAGLAALGTLVMLLWNALIPEIFHLSTITFWQALGLLALSKLLFGGFPHKCGHHHRHHPLHRMGHLTEEEREKIRNEWKKFSCGCDPED